MSEVKRFRDRATECRKLASGARMGADRSVLENLAAELDAEADKMEAEEEVLNRQSDGGPPSTVDGSTD